MASAREKSIKQILLSKNPRLRPLMLKIDKLQTVNEALDHYLPPDLRRHCQAMKWENNKLLLSISNNAWAMQLRYSLPELLEHLRRQPGLHALVSVDFKVVLHRHHATINQPKKPCLRLSCASAQVIQQTAEHIEHTGLKAALERLARHITN